MFKRLYFLLLFTVHVHSVSAITTLHVSQSTDNNPGGQGEPGELRLCLNIMNELLNTAPDDEYLIVFDFPMTIQLNGILPIVNNSPNSVNITIGNSGSIPTVTLDGNSGQYPGLFIPMGNVTIQNMIFQNFTARGGNGGNGIAGGGGGMGAGGAIYAPQTFLDGSYPSITLMNVSTNNCSAVGGNGGNYMGGSSTGNEGGGGGGGFAGNGGSVTGLGSTGGAGGGGFGGNGGSVFLPTDNPLGGGGGGGGGIGSRATIGITENLGNGGADVSFGDDGNGYGLTGSGGTGGGGFPGGIRAGGAGGGGPLFASDPFGGGGGGSNNGFNGTQPLGSTPPGGSATPSGGNGRDGGGGGGGGVVTVGFTNSIDGKAGTGGYAGGGGGGSGTGASDAGYTVQGGDGGTGGGGGAGGVDQSGTTSSTGGNSLGGGGGGAGGPGNGSSGLGGIDAGNLGGGAGGMGANTVGAGFGGGSGGGGSGLGGAIFVDSNLNLTIQAFAGTPTTFNTQNGSTQAGLPGSSGSGGGTNGTAGSALGNSIFLRQGSSLTFNAENTDDLLTLGDQVAFVDDTSFGAGGTNVFVQGNGTVVYNGTTNYAGSIMINNANFNVQGNIQNASVFVCRNSGFSDQRGTLSGTGTLTGDVSANSGTISPDTGETLTLGSLSLNAAGGGSLGSLVEIAITASGDTSVVAVTGAATLAGTLNITLNPSAPTGTYVILTSSGITGTFDSVTFTGTTPNYVLSYLPEGSPTFVQFDFQGYTPDVQPASNFRGVQLKNDFGFEYELYNQLTWTASPSPEVMGYFISRDGTRIATVNAATLSYQDHNRPAGAHALYSLVAFDGDGNTSSPITVTVP